VDGTAQTTSSLSGQTAAVMTSVRFGSGAASHTATCWYDDVVISYTSADHPIGAHKVLSLVPNADGTDSGGTNFTLTGGTTNWEVLDEWPADTTTYIAQTTASGTSYREVQFGDTTETTIWGVHGYLAYFAAGTAANNGTTRIVDSSGNTLTDIFSGDMSESSLFYKSAIIAAPGGSWTQAGLNGVKGRVGFSTDVSPNPRWSALLLQYAVPEASGPTTITRTHSVDADLKATGAKTHSADAFLKATGTKTHSADAFLRATRTKTHSVDAFLRATGTKTHSADADLKATRTKTHSADADLKATGTKTHSVDAFLKATCTKTHSADAFLRATGTKTHSADADLKATGTKTHSADAFL
jgi:hypothetical protein